MASKGLKCTFTFLARWAHLAIPRFTARHDTKLHESLSYPNKKKDTKQRVARLVAELRELGIEPD
jgi:hypothetical protein